MSCVLIAKSQLLICAHVKLKNDEFPKLHISGQKQKKTQWSRKQAGSKHKTVVCLAVRQVISNLVLLKRLINDRII